MGGGCAISTYACVVGLVATYMSKHSPGGLDVFPHARRGWETEVTSLENTLATWGVLEDSSVSCSATARMGQIAGKSV